MQYRKTKENTEISVLGYGCMRFSRKNAKIDIDKTEKEIMTAINAGVNYLDTAYIYPGSEEALGTILEKNNCREKVNIATKLPGFKVKNTDEINKIFDEELKRLKTTYIDFYLIHMLADINAWEKLKNIGIEKWIATKKECGQIKNIGFSFHGDTDTFIKLVDAYGWDFCQIQYNYLDEDSQAGKRGLKYANQKNIPVIIMEPLRGGRLVNFMPDSAKKIIEDYKIKRTPAEWAFRWLWNQPEVTCVLSGMNSLEMVEENVRVASEVVAGEFTEEDLTLIQNIKNEINKSTKVGCTGCGYCMPCPHGVDIPNAFSCYNRMSLEGKNSVRLEYHQITSFKKETTDATKCVRCGKCEKHCPQHIEIRKELKNAQKALQPLPFRLAFKLVKKFM